MVGSHGPLAAPSAATSCAITHSWCLSWYNNKITSCLNSSYSHSNISVFLSNKNPAFAKHEADTALPTINFLFFFSPKPWIDWYRNWRFSCLTTTLVFYPVEMLCLVTLVTLVSQVTPVRLITLISLVTLVSQVTLVTLVSPVQSVQTPWSVWSPWSIW